MFAGTRSLKMSSLVYHPAFDPYHTILRCLRASTVLNDKFYREELELFQFLILFPEILGSSKLTAVTRSAWAKLKWRPRFPYEMRGDMGKTFKSSKSAFEAAFQTLVKERILSETVADDEATLSVSWHNVPESIVEIVDSRNRDESELISVLEKIVHDIPFFGSSGLKERTGLMEFRYDVA